MRLHYIYHSCFALETESAIVIIDYYKDSDIELNRPKLVYDTLLKSSKKLYVLSTHVHHDHFNPTILEWEAIHPDIKYILSSDIKSFNKNSLKNQKVYFIQKGEFYQDETIRVEAFGSTDVGSSFAIKFDNKNIFHAGDLNNWHWKDESSVQEAKAAEQFYLSELKDLSDKHSTFDLVMFPVDQRLQTDYYLGAQQFVENIKVHYFAPMHFDEHYQEANAFAPIAEAHGAKFIKLHHTGEYFDINL